MSSGSVHVDEQPSTSARAKPKNLAPGRDVRRAQRVDAARPPCWPLLCRAATAVLRSLAEAHWRALARALSGTQGLVPLVRSACATDGRLHHGLEPPRGIERRPLLHDVPPQIVPESILTGLLQASLNPRVGAQFTIGVFLAVLGTALHLLAGCALTPWGRGDAWPHTAKPCTTGPRLRVARAAPSAKTNGCRRRWKTDPPSPVEN
jgi:hypothetical protein